MFWDKIAKFYDIFEKLYNGKVNYKLVIEVSNRIEPNDIVLECACGTGMISKKISTRCKELIATDFSDGMLKEAKKNCKHMDNIQIKKANITKLNFKDEEFDKVVAGNVIHLLDCPYEALSEMMRVCKNGGKLIIPTYVNHENINKNNLFIKLLKKFGVDFKKQFDFKSYIEFFKTLEYTENIEYIFIDGKMPCAIAIITKNC